MGRRVRKSIKEFNEHSIRYHTVAGRNCSAVY
jgi:hypothetical protein